MARMVLLHHTDDPRQPDHFDWFIQRPGEEDALPDDRRLVSFRTLARPDDPLARVFAIQPMTDHRAAYLDFEGEIAGGRGRVKRVATGWVSRLESAPDHLFIAGEWEGAGAASGLWRVARTGPVWIATRG
jgi:hypothetical protein